MNIVTGFLIILFPPIDSHGYRNETEFEGWYFITALGGDWKINVVYFLGEIGIVTLIHFFYLQSIKKN
jgi:hypothetical protein